MIQTGLRFLPSVKVFEQQSANDQKQQHPEPLSLCGSYK
jgi:hypothetical protein